jgi:hypothetical protein
MKIPPGVKDRFREAIRQLRHPPFIAAGFEMIGAAASACKRSSGTI